MGKQTGLNIIKTILEPLSDFELANQVLSFFTYSVSLYSRYYRVVPAYNKLWVLGTKEHPVRVALSGSPHVFFYVKTKQPRCYYTGQNITLTSTFCYRLVHSWMLRSIFSHLPSEEFYRFKRYAEKSLLLLPGEYAAKSPEAYDYNQIVKNLGNRLFCSFKNPNIVEIYVATFGTRIPDSSNGALEWLVKPR